MTVGADYPPTRATLPQGSNPKGGVIPTYETTRCRGLNAGRNRRPKAPGKRRGLSSFSRGPTLRAASPSSSGFGLTTMTKHSGRPSAINRLCIRARLSNATLPLLIPCPFTRSPLHPAPVDTTAHARRLQVAPPSSHVPIAKPVPLCGRCCALVRRSLPRRTPWQKTRQAPGRRLGFPIVMEQFWLLRNPVARHVTAVKPSWPGVSAS